MGHHHTASGMTREIWPRWTCALSVVLLAASPAVAHAQQKPIAYVTTKDVTVAGSLAVTNGRAAIGPNATITAGVKPALIHLKRGGNLEVCQTTKIQLSADDSLNQATHPGDNAIMISLDHGAFEEHDTPGKYSDVVLTPDLRILISGPGKAKMSFRVGKNGDTCIDNRGKNAPYVTVTSLYNGGAYRVQPNQRVMFENGDLGEVVDNEPVPCGCPPPPRQVAKAGIGPGHGNSKKNAAARENPFPLAESEGLAAPPPPPTKPVVPPGQVATEVEAPLTYSSSSPPPPAVAGTKTTVQRKLPAPAPGHKRKRRPTRHHGFFGAIGHFFARLFGHK